MSFSPLSEWPLERLCCWGLQRKKEEETNVHGVFEARKGAWNPVERDELGSLGLGSGFKRGATLGESTLSTHKDITIPRIQDWRPPAQDRFQSAGISLFVRGA